MCSITKHEHKHGDGSTNVISIEKLVIFTRPAYISHISSNASYALTIYMLLGPYHSVLSAPGTKHGETGLHHEHKGSLYMEESHKGFSELLVESKYK